MNNGYQLIYIVVPVGKASKVVSYAKKLGATGGTITMAKGTVKNKLMNFLSIYSHEKELIMMGCRNADANKIIPEIVKKFNFEQKNKGIVFSTKVGEILGTKNDEKFENEFGETMYKLITVIVEKGQAEHVLETANEAGARGGTILNARGSGTAETMKLFNMEIEPQKEVLLIVVNNDDYKKVVECVIEKHDIEKPGSGIVFVQDIQEAHGLLS